MWRIGRVFLFILFFGFNSGLYAGGILQVPESEASHLLKNFMQKFGTLVAGLEILQSKEKEPDWESIGISLREMKDTLQKMQEADAKGLYKTYTQQLAAEMQVMEKLNAKKNKKIYKEFSRLTQTCFQCHALHRPVDFLKPKKGPSLSQDS